MQVIKFAKDYAKLKSKSFSTLRFHDKYEKGKVYLIKTPTKEFKARLITMDYEKVKDIPTFWLCGDTDTHSRKQAIKQLQSYYPTLTEESDTVTLLFNKKGLIK